VETVSCVIGCWGGLACVRQVACVGRIAMALERQGGWKRALALGSLFVPKLLTSTYNVTTRACAHSCARQMTFSASNRTCSIFILHSLAVYILARVANPEVAFGRSQAAIAEGVVVGRRFPVVRCLEVAGGARKGISSFCRPRTNDGCLGKCGVGL